MQTAVDLMLQDALGAQPNPADVALRLIASLRLPKATFRWSVYKPFSRSLRSISATSSDEIPCIMAMDRVLGADSFFDEGSLPMPADASATSLAGYMARVEREYLMRALARCGNQMGHTALDLGISRKNLWEKRRKLGMRNESDEDA